MSKNVKIAFNFLLDFNAIYFITGILGFAFAMTSSNI